MINPNKGDSIFTAWKLDTLDSIAIVVSLWFGYFRYPFEPLFCALACIPIIGITRSISKGNATFDNYIKNISSGDSMDLNIVSLYILSVSIALLVGTFTSFECDNYYALAIAGAICFVVFVFILFITHKDIRGAFMLRSKLYIVFILCILFYSYGLIYGLNCLFDLTKHERYKTKIISLYRSPSEQRLRKYFAVISPWGEHKSNTEIAIPPEQYWRFKEGDSAYLELHEGLFEIPWYNLNDE